MLRNRRTWAYAFAGDITVDAGYLHFSRAGGISCAASRHMVCTSYPRVSRWPVQLWSRQQIECLDRSAIGVVDHSWLVALLKQQVCVSHQNSRSWNHDVSKPLGDSRDRMPSFDDVNFVDSLLQPIVLGFSIMYGIGHCDDDERERCKARRVYIP